ncbi:MAG TPA: endo-1,4-beta-xylanase [Polyangiales bacterium]|nr:endo-1,4-beta-xylanase [Polyangiales bacterium]
MSNPRTRGALIALALAACQLDVEPNASDSTMRDAARSTWTPREPSPSAGAVGNAAGAMGVDAGVSGASAPPAPSDAGAAAGSMGVTAGLSGAFSPPAPNDAGMSEDAGAAADSGGSIPPPPGDLRKAADLAQRFVGAAVNAQALQVDQRYAALLASELNSVTPELALQWGALEPARGTRRFDEADSIVRAALSDGQRIHGHAFVSQSEPPSWTTGLSADELLTALHEHIQQTVRRYKGQVTSWNVAHGAIADSLQLREGIHAALGVTGIAQAFKWVKEEDPEARLFYDDHGIEEPNPKTDATVRLLEELLAAGAPIDAVGLQAHLDTQSYPSEPGLRANIQRFAALGLEVAYSELDVKTKTVDPEGTLMRRMEAQRVVYQLLGGVCSTEPSCLGITVWGVTDANTSIAGDEPLLFDASYARKPSFTGLVRGLSGQLPTAGPTLITNGDLDDGTSGWIAFGGGTLSTQTAIARSGSAASVTDRAQTYAGPGHPLPAGLRSQDALCLTAYVRVDSTSARIKATIAATVDGVVGYSGIGTTVASNTSWAEISGCRPIYFDGSVSEATLYFEGPEPGVSIYIDDVTLWTLTPN